MQLKQIQAWERPPLPVNLRYPSSRSLGLEDRWLSAPSSDACLLLYWRCDVMSSVVGTFRLRGMKAPDWLRRAFWQSAKRVLQKGLPSSRKVRNDYYDTRLDPCEARLWYRSAIPPERGTSISRDRLLLK